MRLRPLLGAALAALVLTACQPSASSPPSVEPNPPGGSGEARPSFVGDPELEATLPEEAAGIIFLQSGSASGPDFVAGGEDEIGAQFLAFVEELGADIEDVSVAFAFGADADVGNTATVFAFRVDGAATDELIAAFQAGAPENAAPLEWRAQTVGGKPAQVAEPTDEFPTPVALYATGDTLYIVTSTSAEAFEQILEQLP
jgi:hypothetical protein